MPSASKSINKTSGKRSSLAIADKPINGDSDHKRSKVSPNKTTNDTAKAAKNNIYDWCSAYPGSTVALASTEIPDWNTKFVSWNINGLRAWLKSGGLNYVKEESPDIFAVQETKCPLHNIPSEAKIAGYHSYWYSAEKNGYSGVGLYCKIKPISVKNGIGKTAHDKEDVPNSGQGLVRLPYRDKEWDPAFTAYLSGLNEKKPVIVCGDLNVAHEEIDLANPDTNHKSAGFTDQERAGFTKLMNDTGLVDSFRHLYPDRTSAYTFWSYRSVARPRNTGWRLDYFLVNKQLMTSVCDHELRCGVAGSDHCPIVLYMKL